MKPDPNMTIISINLGDCLYFDVCPWGAVSMKIGEYIALCFFCCFLTNKFPLNTYSFFLLTSRILPHVRTSRGVGPSSLSQCIEDLLGEWEELKSHYSDEKSVSVSPLRNSAGAEERRDSQSEAGFSDKETLTKQLNKCTRQWTRNI